MNSVDAKATQCRITIEPMRVSVEDNGQGFRSRQEIEEWFEVFGQPHEESERKTYGTFRMGRGQLFAFGVNRWRTGKFSMSIDVQNKGLDYDLQNEKSDHKGCHISIVPYSKLLPSDIGMIERDLELWVKWCPIEIYLNDRLISSDPEKVKWTVVTDDAYIRLKPTGSLSIYNLGIHVMDMHGHRLGTGGEVVSKHQLKVNFARNDIQSDCAVWQRLRKVIDQRASDSVKQKRALNDNERQRLVDQLLAGELEFHSAEEMRLITAATGQHFPLTALRTRAHYGEWPQLTSAAKGSRKADNIMRSKVALVVADETLDRFHVKSLVALLKKLDVLDSNSQRRKPFWADARVVDFDELSAGLADKFEVIPQDDLTPSEQLWLELIAKGMSHLRSKDSSAPWRRIHVGRSDSADGWTDGGTYICINRDFLKKQEFDVPGFVSIGHLLLHEMCHHEPDLNDHDHDQEFYEEFHDNADCVGHFASSLLSYVPRVCKSLGRRQTKSMLHTQSKLVAATDALAEFPHVKIRKP